MHEQSITVDEASTAYTRGAAFALHAEAEIGVAMTVVGGKVVSEAE